jgi:peptidyl-prolyl cis-trans isomerase D
MISWIQRTFQHHFKFIFAFILAATIISFVVTIGAQGGVGRADRTVARRDFFGHNLGSAPDYQRMVSDARISVMLQLGDISGLDDEQLKNYTLQRAAALHFADELHLPAATPTELEGFIRNLRIFAGENGQFDASRYAAFRANGARMLGVTEEDLARVLAEDIRMNHVQQLLDGPGYVLPGDVRDQFVHMETSWTVGIATVDYASYHPAIEPTEAELAKYFNENELRYQIAPRVEAAYVDFPSAPHLPDVKVTDAEVRAFYDADPTRFPTKVKPAAPITAGPAGGPKGPTITPPVTPDAAFASVRTDVETTFRQERARRAALKAASDFGYDLYQNKVAASAFDAFLASRQLVAKPLAPFTQDAGPAELGSSPDIGEAAFKLDAEHYYSEALPTPDGAAIVIWKAVEPTRKPALAEVRAKVLADYQDDQRRQRFVALGHAIKADLQARLKGGQDFAKAAAAAAATAGVKIEAKVLPAFTLHAPPTGLDDTVAATLEHLEKGTLSDMVATADKGYLVYALDRKEPDPKASAARVAEVRGQLAAYSARSGSSAYFAEMVAAELKRTAAATAQAQ